METTTKPRKWGNSLGITIPKGAGKGKIADAAQSRIHDTSHSPLTGKRTIEGIRIRLMLISQKYRAACEEYEYRDDSRMDNS